MGVKVTLTVQLEFGARVVPHDGCSPKSFGSAPPMVKPKGLTKLAATLPSGPKTGNPPSVVHFL